MHLRKFLLAGSMLTAAALALIPAAQATTPHGPIAKVAVGGSTSTANYAVTATLQPGASVTLDVYGTPTTLACTSGGSATGTVHAGNPAPNPVMNFSSLTLACDSVVPGLYAVITVPANGCANITKSDAEVHTGYVDSGPITSPRGNYDDVELNFNLPAGCNATATIPGVGCTITFTGSTRALFDETKTASPHTQQIRLTGSGLWVHYAPLPCLGAVNAYDQVTFNNIAFDVTTTGGAIDFQD
jgi:hypothetical protein